MMPALAYRLKYIIQRSHNLYESYPEGLRGGGIKRYSNSVDLVPDLQGVRRSKWVTQVPEILVHIY